MNLSAKPKAAMTPKETFFTVTDKKYFADPRWALAKKLAREVKYPECQKMVAKIDKDHGRY